MDDPRWLRLITIGLVLAAMAVGYFLISGRFSSNQTAKTPTKLAQASASVQPVATISPNTNVASVQPSMSPMPTVQPVIINPSPEPVGQTTKGGLQLPRTGSSVFFLGITSLGLIISGWSLRKYPH